MEVGPAAHGRSKLSAAIKETVSAGGSALELVTRTEIGVPHFDIEAFIELS